MTFIISSSALPKVTGLPAFETTSQVNFDSILVSGSLLLAKPEDLLTFAGKNTTNYFSLSNSAEAVFRKTYGDVQNINFYIRDLPDKTIGDYITLSQEKGGLRFSCNRAMITPASAKIAKLMLFSASNSAIVLSQDKNVYLDAWIEMVNQPVLLGNTSKSWADVSTLKASADESPTGIGQRISLSAQNLQKTTQDNTWFQKPSAGSGQLLSSDYLSSSFETGKPAFVASAGAVSSSNAANLTTLAAASILEGGYMAQDFILYSVYMEDLTVSGRTANQVAQFRKKQFEKFFEQ